MAVKVATFLAGTKVIQEVSIMGEVFRLTAYVAIRSLWRDSAHNGPFGFSFKECGAVMCGGSET